jgi:preprotein translocase subunit SecE
MEYSAFTESPVSSLIKFFQEAYEELKKVTWLNKPQLIASTWLVILLVIIFSIYVGILDYIIARTFGLLV